jgi:hypothetical protein
LRRGDGRLLGQLALSEEDNLSVYSQSKGSRTGPSIIAVAAVGVVFVGVGVAFLGGGGRG